MKKKIITLCLVIALAATAIVGGTLAYFTDTKEATNTFTVGNVEIELTEPNWVEDQTVYPGETLEKDPTIKNDGTNPCYVRVKVTGLDQFEDAITLNDIGTDWVKGAESDAETTVLYYTKPVAAGETAPTAFASITIPTSIENGAETMPVVVTAEAIQSEGFDSYTAAFTAFDAE